MPVTIVVSFFFMHLAGQTLNMPTLMAIGLSTGVLVSNSIVVLENIFRHREELDAEVLPGLDQVSGSSPTARPAIPG